MNEKSTKSMLYLLTEFNTDEMDKTTVIC